MKPKQGTAPPGYGRNKRKSTTMKLWLGVVVAHLIALFVAITASQEIRKIPDSPTIETAWFVAYYGSMLLVGLAMALWIDHIAFKGAFQKTHLQGISARFSKKNADVEEVAATLQRSSMSFSFSLLGCTLFSYLLSNYVNHDFDPYYRQVGRHLSVLHDSPQRNAAEAKRTLEQKRRDAIVTLSFTYRPEVLPALVKLSQREDEVGQWAIWAMRRHREDSRAARIIPPLIKVLNQSKVPEKKREALLTLSRWQHRVVAPQVRDELQAELETEAKDPDQKIDIRLIWALAYLQTLESLDLLGTLLHHPDLEIQRSAAWAIAQHGNQQLHKNGRKVDSGRRAVALLEDRLPSAAFQLKCALVQSLEILGDESSNEVLTYTFDQLQPEEIAQNCPAQSLNLRPDGAGSDRQDLFIPEAAMGMKILRAMGRMRATSPPCSKAR